MSDALYRPEPLAPEGGRELLPGVHRIESEIGGRPLYQFLLRGDRTVLVDTGVATTPDEILVPYLDRIGLAPSEIDLVICTHADGDHHGGNRAVAALAPDALVTCGSADRALVEHPETLIADRLEAYRVPHGLGYDDALLASVHELAPPARVDITWSGGELLRIAEDWELRIVRTPGHSHGHVAVHDVRHRALYMGDAIHGAYYPGFDGEARMPPNYVDVDAYLATIDAVEALDVDVLHGAHWPVQEPVDAFLADAREEVARTRDAVCAALVDGGRLTLQEIVAKLGGWSQLDLMYAVDAQLSSLERSGRVARERASGRDGFRWTG